MAQGFWGYTNINLKCESSIKRWIFWGWNQTRKNWQNCGTPYSCNIQHMKKVAHYFFWKRSGCSGIFLIQILMEKHASQNGCLFYVVFTSTLTIRVFYSVLSMLDSFERILNEITFVNSFPIFPHILSFELWIQNWHSVSTVPQIATG